MSIFTISTTEKNKPLLILNGFSYTVDRSTDKKTYWKCEYARSITCKGRVHTDLNHSTILNDPSEHNHPPSAVKSEVRLFQDKIRSRAVNTTESTQQVIDNCLRDVTDQMVARLPNFKHVKRTIQRQRIVHDLPKIPHDKTFSTVPASLTTTIRGETFLQYDSGPGEHRILIFASSEQLDILSECEEVLIDGTFKMTPTIFTQLYTIHGVYRDAVFPLVFTLLSDKQQATYEKVINQLRLLRPSWNPKSVMVDFEKAAINAFQKVFNTPTSQISVSGCFFHLQKSILRKVQDLGLKINYETDSKFAHDVNKIGALAFLLPGDVQQGFDNLYSALPPIVEPLLDYFEDNYIGRRRPNGRATPRYPVELWNMRERTLNDAMRTNNNAEAWHRRFNSVIDCEHPSLWVFIQSIQKEENYIHCQLVKTNAGQSSQQSKKYLDYNKRLKALLATPHSTLLRQVEFIALNL